MFYFISVWNCGGNDATVVPNGGGLCAAGQKLFAELKHKIERRQLIFDHNHFDTILIYFHSIYMESYTSLCSLR